MRTEQSIPYETNAERRTVGGWCCKTCGRFCGDRPNSEMAAKYCCCTDRPCQRCPTGRAQKYYTLCDSCKELESIDRFLKLEAKPYDGSAVCEWNGDRYFFDEDELLEWIAENGLQLEDLQLVFAEQKPLHWHRSISESFGIDTGDGEEWDTSEIDKQIEEWVVKHAPTVYQPTKIAVLSSTIPVEVAAPAAAERAEG